MKNTNNTSKELNFIITIKLFIIYKKLSKKKDLNTIKLFIRKYYGLDKDMPNDFYEMLLKKIDSKDSFSLFKVITNGNIYSLISYLKSNQKDEYDLEEIITPLDYYLIPKKHINKIIDKLKNLEVIDENNYLKTLLDKELIWKLRKVVNVNNYACRMLAYKIYLSIGLNNGLELLEKKYGEIDYEKIYFLFSELNVKDNFDVNKQQYFNDFIFGDKKDGNNIIRQMLNGRFKELFLNFDYFYNNFNYFIDKLGIKMTSSKVKLLLEERYLAKNVSAPEITGDILDDMISSYHNKYDYLDVSEQEIHNINFNVYDDYLRNKYKSSIPMIESINIDQFTCEVIKLSDPRNLVLGYRAGNCFRINGDAPVLFHQFLQSEHMRLLSISTEENKDFAMMLIMRNGNVLIGQGIEVSKWAPSSIKGKKLYDACKTVLKEMMDYMNSMGDEIVATIIGSSNSNVSDYNNQILPFLVSPILENSQNYYNGLDNYQCLMDLSEGKSIQEIKLYEPTSRYLDKREPILRRKKI